MKYWGSLDIEIEAENNDEAWKYLCDFRRWLASAKVDFYSKANADFNYKVEVVACDPQEM